MRKILEVSNLCKKYHTEKEEIDANIYVDYNVVWRESTKKNQQLS